jgi:hypothetical protein
MKYTVETKINAQIEKVAQILAHPEQRLKWFKNISKYQLIKGRQGQVGAKAHLWINILGEREVTETILAVDYPYHFTVLYEMPEGKLKLDGKLKAPDRAHTIYTLEHQFTFNGFLTSIGVLMKSGFKKQSEAIMLIFKKEVEKL